jgi:hypothetical protein
VSGRILEGGKPLVLDQTSGFRAGHASMREALSIGAGAGSEMFTEVMAQSGH